MRVTDCDIWTVVVPARPGAVNSPEFGPATWDQVPKHLIRLRTGDGVYGLGETGRGCPRAAVESAAAQLVGKDPLAIPLQELPLAPATPEAARPGRSYEGVYGPGRSNPAYDAFEMALFDLVGRLLGLPAHALLGGAVRRRVPADYWIGQQMPEDAGRAARRGKEMGFHGLKMKCAIDDPWVERMQAILDAAGPDFKVTIDPNERFYRPEEAIRLARTLERFPNVAIYEDPVPKRNLDWYRQIRAAITVPVALHLGNPRDVVNAIKAEACDHLNLGGGMVQFVRNAAMAAAAGMLCWHGSGVDLGIAEHAYLHAAACARNCVLPSDLVGSWVREDDLIVTPLHFEDGHALVPETPGLGCELDEAAVERYAAAHA
jgi:muconate cycloisomerase